MAGSVLDGLRVLAIKREARVLRLMENILADFACLRASLPAAC